MASSSMKAIHEAKKGLRLVVKARVASLTSAQRSADRDAVSSRMFEHSAYQNAKRVGIFLSMSDEVDISPIITNIFDSSRQCFVPKYDGKSSHMDFYSVESEADIASLPRTKWDIQQPDDVDGREDAMLKGLDLLIVPGLAFACNGDRLGRGRGYYDTYLERMKKAADEGQLEFPKLIGVGFSCQLIEDTPIPVSEHDFTLDEVLCGSTGKDA